MKDVATWTNADIDRLLEMMPIFEAPDFVPATWQESWTDEKGVMHMPYPHYHPDVDKFMGLLGDYNSTMAAQGRPTPEQLPTASVEEVRRFLLAVRRGEYHGDGSIDQAFEKGWILAALRRLQEIRGDRR